VSTKVQAVQNPDGTESVLVWFKDDRPNFYTLANAMRELVIVPEPKLRKTFFVNMYPNSERHMWGAIVHKTFDGALKARNMSNYSREPKEHNPVGDVLQVTAEYDAAIDKWSIVNNE
jgi:hypothetical protein